MLVEKYRGWSCQRLLEEAYDQGVRFEQHSGSCSQCTVAGRYAHGSVFMASDKHTAPLSAHGGAVV